MSEQQYHNILEQILHNGTPVPNRTGIDSISIFCPPTMMFDLQDGKSFPLLTKKKVNFKAVLAELLWFISGSTNIKDLDSKIWDAWATEDGDVGKMYGYQLRRKSRIEATFSNVKEQVSFEKVVVDQLQNVIDNIKENPYSRRHVITLWDAFDLPDEKLSPQENVKQGKMALACCHGTVIQFYVNGDKLSASHYQRSADYPIGVPFNIASYATLLMVVAKLTGYKADKLYFMTGDSHIYTNQIEGVNEYLSRKILNEFPSLEIKGEQQKLEDFVFDDFVLDDYVHQEFIKTAVNV